MAASSTRDGGDDTVRRRILEAVLEVIASDGLDAVRHRRVAELAGVSLGSTTYHFSGRDELIEAAFGHYLDEATAFLDRIEVRARRNGGLAAAIVEYIERLLSEEFAEDGMVQAEYELILYAARAPRIARRLHEWEAAQCAYFEDLLSQEGAPRPADGARTLLALIRGLELERLTTGAPVRHLRSRVEPVARSIIEG